MINLEQLQQEYALEEIEGNRFVIDLMYAKSENISGHPVYQECGFGNRAYLNKEAREALLKLVPILEEQHFKLLIADSFRPTEAHNRLLELVPVPGLFKSEAALSMHCKGLAIDCCLVHEDGTFLEYPTAIDAYTPEFAQEIRKKDYKNYLSHLQKGRHDYYDLNQECLFNRTQLKKLMERCGFQAIPNEWWHYNFINKNN